MRLIAVAVAVSVAVGCSQPEQPVASVPTSAPSTSIPAPTVDERTAVSDACEGRPVAETLQKGAHADRFIESSGAERTYKLYVPNAYDATPTPLVIDLHGYLSGAAGQIAMSDLSVLAESAGFVVATPQGNGPMPYWNAVPEPDLPDDVRFVEDVIDDVGAVVCLDTTRIYVQGFSNGAFLASLIACRLSDEIAAIAAVAGLQVPRDCSPTRPIPVLGIHGTEDRFVSFGGGPNDALDDLTWNAESTRAFEDLPFAPVTDTLSDWATIGDCTGPAEEDDLTTSVTRVRYDNCEDGATLELYILDGAGHTWPGSDFAKASELLLGPASDEISANEIIWAFFERHDLAG